MVMVCARINGIFENKINAFFAHINLMRLICLTKIETGFGELKKFRFRVSLKGVYESFFLYNYFNFKKNAIQKI